MEALRDRKNLVAPRRFDGHAQCVLVGLGTRVDEKDAVEPFRRNTRQAFGSLGPDVQRHGVALEQQLAALLLDRGNQPGVPVAERRHGMAAVEVQDSPAIARIDVAAAGAFRHERELPVDRNR